MIRLTNLSRGANEMLLGLSGQARHGKGTAARILTEQYGFIEYSFAARLKTICRDTGTVNYSDEQERTYHARSSWQSAGSMARYIDSYYWIKELAANPLFIKSLLNKKDIVISDVRYINELFWIITCGGCCIRIIRIDKENKPICALDVTQRHAPSETAMSEGVEKLFSETWRIPDSNDYQQTLERKVEQWTEQTAIAMQSQQL